jgi:hypothetical protein
VLQPRGTGVPGSLFRMAREILLVPSIKDIVVPPSSHDAISFTQSSYPRSLTLGAHALRSCSERRNRRLDKHRPAAVRWGRPRAAGPSNFSVQASEPPGSNNCAMNSYTC